MSNDAWNFTTKDGLIYIQNISKNEVLGGTKGEIGVSMENRIHDKAVLLWKKGETDNEGYFWLEKSKEPKLMTAVSSRSIEIKGNT